MVVLGRKFKIPPHRSIKDYDIIFISSEADNDSQNQQSTLTNLMITFSSNTVRLFLYLFSLALC